MSDRPKGWPWSALDLKRAPADAADLRRAYARKLKAIDQSKDIAGFETLRAAYEEGQWRLEQKASRAARKSPPPMVVEAPLHMPAAAEMAPPPAPRTPAQTAPSPQEKLAGLFAGLEQDPSVERALAILADPEFGDAEFDPELRQGFAAFLHDRVAYDDGQYELSEDIPPSFLRALDARFGWLSDYAAFRRDFFFNDQMLLDALLDRSGLIKTPFRVTLAHPSWWQRLSIQPRLIVFAVIILLNISRAALSESASDTLLFIIFGLILAAGALWYLVKLANKFALVAPPRVGVAVLCWGALSLMMIAMARKSLAAVFDDPVLLWIWFAINVPTLSVWILWRPVRFALTRLGRSGR